MPSVRPLGRSVLGICLVAAVVSVIVAFSRTDGDSAASVALAAGRLDTAVVDPDNFPGPERRLAFAHVRAAGATFARLSVNWDQVAPEGKDVPSGFEPRNPGDPRYRWQTLDDEIRAAHAAGLRVILDIQGAPLWARGKLDYRGNRYDGPFEPSPSALADFATAAATRYGGSFGGLPRVRYWQVWNEPNLTAYLVPLEKKGRLYSPLWYRSMVNAMADAVHAVHRDNVVVAGGLAPFGVEESSYQGISPLAFMRALLCMSAGSDPRPTCDDKVSFDVWAHHPYTFGGPTHRAAKRDDVSLGDLGRMRQLLLAAARAGHIRTRGALRFWVTEFSWDTDPPDPKGVPIRLQTRWVAEALYRMWKADVSLVAWFLVRDQPYDAGNPYLHPFQSGLYYRRAGGIAADRPKPTLEAFRFPFVAFRAPRGEAAVWGRTPPGAGRRVVVEERVGSRWVARATLTANRDGIFAGRVRAASRNGSLRARLVPGREASVPFSLRPVPDRRVSPFGY